MVFRDQGPRDTLPYGVSMASMPVNGDEELAGSPDAGGISKYFQDKPLQKFLAASALTIGGAVAAGVGFRKGGQYALSNIAVAAAKNPDNIAGKYLKSHREIQKVLDEYGGILSRTRGQYYDDAGRFIDDDPTRDQIVERGFFLTEGEREYARRNGLPSVAQQTLQDAMQQRLVKLARRAPYELPAAYVTQRAFSDRLLGIEDDEPTNWKNPLDVFGDFAEQSMKNLAFSFLPFEGAAGAAKHGWNKALTNAANSNYHGIQKVARDAVVDINTQLSRVGQDFTDIAAQAIRYSRKSTGAAATSIVNTSAKQRGLVDHINMIRQRGAKDWWKDIISGEEVFGPLSKSADIFRGFKKASNGAVDLDDVYTNVYKARGGSKFEQYIDSISRLRYSGPKFNRATFRQGQFYQGIADAEYKKLVQSELIDSGVDADIASDFVTRARLTRARGAGSATDLTNRISFGEKILDDNIEQGLRRTLKPMYDEDAVDAISKNITNAMKHSDRRLHGMRAQLDEKARRAWEQTYGDVIGRQTKNVLGVSKARYADFDGDMSSASQEFLVRRTAERLGIPLTERGAQVSTSRLRDAISARGLDAGNKYGLRGFLIDQGDISKPWRASGRNVFGFAPVTVGQAYRSGYFKDSDQLGDIKDFMRQVRQSDWDSTLIDRMKLGGVYQTASGRVVDINPIKKGTQKFFDRVRDEWQIPLIHTRPMQLIFSKRERDLIKFNATGVQPFMAGEIGENSIGQMWFRTGRRGGTLADIGFDPARGRASARILDGSYRNMSTNASAFHNENLRLAMGDTGRFGSRDPNSLRGRVANFFGIDEYQPDSLVGKFRRFRDRGSDLSNRGTFSARILEAGSARELARKTSKTEVARGADKEFQFWRRQTFSPNLLRKASTSGQSVIDDLYRFDGKQFGFDDITDLRQLNSRQVEKLINRTLNRELGDSLDDSTREMIEKAQNNLLSRWRNVQDFDATLSAGKRSLGLQRAKDEAILDFMKLQSIEKSLRTGQSYDDIVNGLMGEVDDLFARGMITRTEVAEARTTIGSMNQMYRSIRFYDPQQTAQQNLLNTLDGLMGSGYATVDDNMRKVIQDTRDYMTEGPIRGPISRRFGSSDYDFDGTLTNPFGGDNVFVPTFGTTFGRNPYGAIKSALGINTWSDPDSFSTTGLIMSQGVNRMNDALAIAGLRVGTSSFMTGSGQFRGPLDLLARGMVGSRVLPAYAAGAGFMALDRTAGGMVYGDDEEGNKVYRPLITSAVAAGVAEIQIASAGLFPGGSTAAEKREEIYEGETAVRRGRWWPLGKTPWRGGKVDYYRPSWYRRLTSGYQYTDQGFGSPLERLAFGYDFSPLRPLDPYRFEREQGRDRPYPVSGDYFTGPWGPVTPMLNMTVGRILKPKTTMFESEVAQAMQEYQPVGAYGMAYVPGSSGAQNLSSIGVIPGAPTAVTGGMVPGTGQYSAASRTPAYASGSVAAGNQLMASNQRYSDAAGIRNGVAASQIYPYTPFVSANANIPNNVVAAMQPISSSGMQNQMSELAYRTQEFAGIYGFGFGGIREQLGFGSMEYENARPVFAQAGEAYGASRQFWDLNLGGLGDVPTPLEGEYANLEASEIIRRFIPKPRSLNTVNPIRNSLGMQQPWLPGEDYFIDFTRGDPFVKVAEGEMRLPGIGYERFNDVRKDESGVYSPIDQFKILADVAPYSREYESLKAQLQSQYGSDPEFLRTLEQVAMVKKRHNFTPYKYRDSNVLDPRRHLESLAHADTYFNNKFMPNRTALEDWERNYVYGSNFPQWQNPYRDFIKPMAYKAADRDPLQAAGTLAVVGSLMGASREAKAIGSLVGAVGGFAISLGADVRETLTGDRFVPQERRREIAVEEYADILQYTKSMRGFEIAQQMGDSRLANQFRRQMQSTMYGADIYGASAEELAMAVPKRKREHFMEFLNAPEQDREKILSTAGRLERRMYQAYWGMRVEKKPDLGEYFQQRELPGPEWEGWDPRVSMEHVKIKMLQQQGLNLSQMGYYPQQIMEANLVNPSYPDFSSGTPNAMAEIQRLMELNGMSGGSVRMVPTPYPGVNVEFINGV